MKIKSAGLDFLAVPEEKKEIEAVGTKDIVTLKRTFNMTIEGVTLKFWRVMGPTTHKNYHSDLTQDGLKDWGIIPDDGQRIVTEDSLKGGK